MVKQLGVSVRADKRRNTPDVWQSPRGYPLDPYSQQNNPTRPRKQVSNRRHAALAQGGGSFRTISTSCLGDKGFSR